MLERLRAQALALGGDAGRRGRLGRVRRRSRAAPRPGRARLAGALAAAGAPLRLSELGIDAGTARWALLHCHLMRDRFTVADLAFLLGIWEAGDVDALLDDAGRLGVGL